MAIGTRITTDHGTVTSVTASTPLASSGGATPNISLTGIVSGANGGTGVANTGLTLTLGGNLTTSGAFASTFTMTNTTAVTFPTSGTLATTAQLPTLPLSLSNGGTNANLTASNGGIFYSTGSAGAILAGTATANQVLLSGSSTTPAWSTATYPATTTINQLLYSSADNVIAGVTAGDYGVLISSSSGVPSWLANGTTGQILTATTSGTPSWAAAPSAQKPWTSETSNTSLVTNNGYFAASASQLTFTLPTTAAVGDTFEVAASAAGTGGFIIAQNLGQQIQLGNLATTSGTGGKLTAHNGSGDWIKVVCSVANTNFVASVQQGSFDVT